MVISKRQVCHWSAVALLPIAGGSALPACGTPALSFNGGSVQSFPGYTVGWSFTANAPITVDALDYSGTSTLENHDVGIYTASGTLLTSATVQTTGGAPSAGTYDTAIVPLTLLPGNYVIAGTTATDGDFQAFCSSVTTSPDITYGQGQFIFSSNVLTFPTSPSDRGIAYFGPNIDIQTPEPAGCSLLAIGAIGVVRRRRR